MAVFGFFVTTVYEFFIDTAFDFFVGFISAKSGYFTMAVITCFFGIQKIFKKN